MGRIAVALLSCVVFGCASPQNTPPAEKPDEARAALRMAIESMGGEDAVAAINGMRLQTRGEWQGMGLPMAMPYTAEIVHQLPDCQHWNMTAMGMTMASGMRGGEGWSMMGSPAARVAGEMRKHYQEMGYGWWITLVRPLLHTEGLTLSGGALETVDGEPVRRVNVTFPGGRKYVLTFTGGDKTVLTGYEGDVTYWKGGDCVVRAKFADHTAFGDITLPSSTEVQLLIDGKVEETVKERWTSVQWNPEIPDGFFDMPDTDVVFMDPAAKQAAESQGVMVLHKGAYSGTGATIKKAMALCTDAGLVPMGSVTMVCVTDPATVKDESELRAEIVVPVMLFGPPPTLPEGATMKTIPAGTVASITARGPYGEADVAALEALMAWIAEAGHEVTGPPRIVYFHDPEMFVAEDLVSEVQVPINEKG